MYLTIFLAVTGLLLAESSGNSGEGMILPDSLQTAVVVADKGLVVSRADTLPINPGTTITEVLRQSPSLYIGDNGGAAGLKTVNLRGLGSAHTTIYVDGVRIGNVQSGQTDLTNLGLGQFGSAVIDYVQNSISFTTRRPEFESGRNISGQASLSAGSFGTWQPYARMDFKLDKNTAISANASGLVSKGDFTYGDNLTRENNDIRQISGGLNAFGLLQGGKWHTKVHYNGSDRGTPGTVSWPSTDRQSDRNVYAQGLIEERFNAIYGLTASAKYAFDRMDYISEWGNSRYDQQEIQANTAHRFTVTRWLDLSLAADFTWDHLASTACNADRYSPSAAIGAAFRAGPVSADIAIEYDGAMDRDGLSRHTLSPSAGLRLSIPRGPDLTAFARRAYRVPTFNELYYTGYGNPELKPEDAFLSGVGINITRPSGPWILSAAADGFLNLLSDKIVSAPTKANPYLWLPYNIGRVRSLGADITAGVEYAKSDWTAGLKARYGCQSATDRTPDSESFGQQIPYVSKHTVFINGTISINGWKVDAGWNLHAGLRDGSGQMPDWNTLDATLSKEFRFRGCGPLSLFVSGKNLLDCRYESVSGYPMPGRSVTGGFVFKF